MLAAMVVLVSLVAVTVYGEPTLRRARWPAPRTTRVVTCLRP